MFFTTIILGIITFLLVVLHWYQTRSRFAKLLNQFPTTPYKPLIGHVADYSSNPETLFPQVRKLMDQFKETFSMWSVCYGSVHVVTPDDAEIILSNMNYIKKGLMYQIAEPWLREGLLTSEGGKWQHRRKILTPTFHFNILRRFVEIFGEHSNELVQKLKQETKNNETNLIPLITHETLSSICETAMGTKLDYKDKKHLNYLNAVSGVIPTMVSRCLKPLYYINITFWLSPLGIRQNKYIKTLHQFTTNIIKEREANFKNSDVSNLDDPEDDLGMKKKRLAMLDLLISAKKNRGEIDFEGIREEVDTFMFEGHDTTAIAICMNLMLLAHHKDHQDKIIDELNEIFGDDDRPASYEDLMKMKYLEMCIKEGLRLYPSVPFITRTAPKDIQLTHHTAPAGCEIFIWIYKILRNEQTFPEPDKYDPDRFLPENCKGRNPYAYIPFSAGPRNCIGQKYALLEMKSVSSAIFRNFTLEPVSDFKELRWTTDMILRVKGPINVKFISRKSLSKDFFEQCT